MQHYDIVYVIVCKQCVAKTTQECENLGCCSVAIASVVLIPYLAICNMISAMLMDR